MRYVRIKHIVCLLAAGGLISGCAGRQHYEHQLNAYVGQSIDRVIEQGNIPTREYAMASGNRLYCFDARQQMSTPYVAYPTQSVSTVNGNNVVTTTFGNPVMGGATVSMWCNTCFVTDKNRKILRYTLKGNSCVDLQ